MKSPDRAPYRACICSRVLVSTDDDLALAPSHAAPMELDTHPELIEQVNAGHYATFKAVHRNPVPVIVAVHGVVLGGGIVLPVPLKSCRWQRANCCLTKKARQAAIKT